MEEEKDGIEGQHLSLGRDHLADKYHRGLGNLSNVFVGLNVEEKKVK